MTVLGYIVRGPLGGLCWHHLQYVLGLAAAGHDVLFVEDSDDYPACYDPSTDQIGTDPAYGLAFAKRTFDDVGLGERWAYWCAHTSAWRGPAAAGAEEHCRTSELVLNLSAVNPLRDWCAGAPYRALVDTDPVFTQIRHLADADAMTLALRHTAFLTFGENFGRPGCSIPDDGLPWIATRQPVHLPEWEVSDGPRDGRFTTVMQWDSYPAREWAGRRYGMKSESLGPYMSLPAETGAPFELAIGSPNAPRDELAAKGWSIVDPREPTKDARSYQRYIRGSKAEFSVAKHGYVVSRSGWFSERSAVYLASGRPAVLHDTGFTEWLDADGGVLPFDDPEGARARIAELAADYERHARAARRVAEEYFDARRVVPALVEAATRSAGSGSAGG